MSSVTFPANLGGNGQTYTDDNDPSTGLRDGGWRTRFVPCLEQTVAIANTLTNRVIFGSDVSSTSIAVSVGSKTLTTSGSFTWAAGMFVTIARTSATANYLFGQVVSYNASTDVLVVNVTSVAGSGTFTDWTIAIAPPGLAPSSFTGPTTIAVSSASDALRITQTGSGNALVVEDSANPDSTPFVITTDGRQLLGHTTSLTAQGITAQIQNNGTSAGQGGGTISNTYWQANATASAFLLNKSRSATPGSYSILSNGDGLGIIAFGGDDGTAIIRAAAIDAAVDSTPGTNDMPGRLVFSTTADGASSPTERMRISSAGNVGIGVIPGAGRHLIIGSNITGNTTSVAVFANGTVQSDVTSNVRYFQSSASTAVGSYTTSSLIHFYANQGTFGLGSIITNQYGFNAETNLTGATNNYGFYSNIASGTGRYNFYAAGTADNYFGGPVVVSASSSSDALRITQTGTGNALVVEDSANPDATPFAVDASGNVGIGVVPAFAGNKLSIAGAGTDASSWLVRYSADASSYEMRLLKSRSTSIYSKSVVQSGDFLGLVSFGGDDGTNYNIAAFIAAAVDGTPGLNDMPGRLVFSTTADGASSPTERMRIDNAGRVVIAGAVGIGATPAADNYNLRLGGSFKSNQFPVLCFADASVPSTAASGGAYVFRSQPRTDAASFSISALQHFTAEQGTFGAGSSVTNQIGFVASSNLTGATNNYGFYSNIASGTGRYNFYAAGTADNYFAGAIKSNTTVAGGYTAHAAGTTAMALGVNNVVKVTPNATATFTTTVAPAGAKSSVIIVTSGTTSYTIIFGTGFLTTGTLATGTVTAKTFVVNFVSDGTTMIETSRTVAM